MISDSQDINLSLNAMEFMRFMSRLNEIKDKLNVHLIPIKTRKKTPDVFSNWNNENITQDSALARINELHSNVGIVAHEQDEKGNLGLCFIDVDLVDGKFPIPKDKIDELLAIGTFTVRTKSGGLQFYFINKGLTENFRSRGLSTNPRYSIEGSPQECGEIRTNVAYVLAPGSFVPIDYEGGKKGAAQGATGLYSVFADNPIKELTPDNFPKWITLSNVKNIGGNITDTKIQEEFVGKSKEIIDTQIGFDPKLVFKLKPGEDIVNEKGLSISQIMEMDKEFAEILTVVGEKGTRSERDWFIARRMRAMGFSANQVAQALITYRPYEKTPGAGARGYINYLAITIRNAYTHEITTYDPHQNWYANYAVSDITKSDASELPEELPDVKYVLIQAPPRTGKTHWSIRQLIKHSSGVYTTNKHEIIRHAIGIFKRLEKRKTAVYLVGKDRACNRITNRGECGTCQKCPHIHPGYDSNNRLRQDVLTVQNLRYTASKLLHQHQVLTPDILMKNESICPYYILLLAEYESDFCFTIPYFLTSDREIKRVKRTDRNILIIDEDPVVTSFYPSEYEIASYSYGKGNKNFTNTLGIHMETVLNIEKSINEQKRKTSADKEILRLCEILHTLDDKMNAVVDSTTVEGKKEFDNWIKIFDVSNDYDKIMKLEIEKRLKRLEQVMKENDREIELFPLFAPLIYVADKSFVWLGGSPSKTLYLIADREVMYTPPEFYKKVLIIGATQSELYIQDVCGDINNSKIIIIDKFKYAENFLLLKLKASTRREETRMLYSLMFKFAQDNASSNLVSPALVLTSSKQKQQKLQNLLQSRCMISTDQGEPEQLLMWLFANMNIFYSNSTLSRGLDIPQYSTLFVESVKFAIPYFTAIMEHAQETGNVAMVKRAKAIISKITVDEITNSVLRHSPTVDDPTETFKKEERIKIVVIRDRDASSILSSVSVDMNELEVNTMQNIDLAIKLISVTPDRFDKTAIPRTLAENCPEHIIQHYCGTLDTKFSHEITKMSPTTVILKSNLKSFLESTSNTFPKNNAIALADPKIKTVLKNYPAFNEGKRVSENALIRFISSNITSKKDLNKVDPKHAHKNTDLSFGDIKVDKRSASSGSKSIPMEGFIRKTLANLVKGELLKTEIDDGKRFYRRVPKDIFDKLVFG